MGINKPYDQFYLCLGSALAGAGGVLIGFVLQLDRAFDGDDTRDQSLVAAVLGGIGIIQVRP